MTFKELRQSSGMTQKAFAEYFGIPKRTIENWDSERRKCPEYLLELMQYKLESKLENERVNNMTRNELIKQLEEIKEQLAWENIGLTDYAREHAYISVDSAIEYVTENEEK